jgi:putative cell wall-binding protein
MAVLAVVCALLATAGSGGSKATAQRSDDEPGRISGANRYATAAAVALDTFPDGADAVVLVSGSSFSDAVAAAGFAGSVSAPILLTARDRVPRATRTALTELDPAIVYAVGGSRSVGEAVIDELATRWRVERLAGNDRYATSARLAAEMGARPAGASGIGTLGGLRTAVVATGGQFPDALAAGPLAYARGLPVLLVEPDGVPTAVRSALEELGVQQVLVVGGQRAVSGEVEETLVRLVGHPALRLAGETRYATAARVAAFTLGASSATNAMGTDVVLAGGRDFADAAVAAPLAARAATAMVLTPRGQLPRVTAEVLLRYDTVLERVRTVGGEQAVGDDVVSAAQAAIDVDPSQVVDAVRLSWVGVVDDGAFFGGRPGAVGAARLRLEPDKGVIVYDVDLGSLEAPSPSITIGRGPAGAPGPVLWSLRRSEPVRVTEPWSGVLFEDDLNSEATIADLVARPEEFHLAVASGQAPDSGAALMRGQLPDGGLAEVATQVGALTVPLDAQHVVDAAGGEPVFGASDEPGTATVRLSFDVAGGRISFAVDARGLEGNLAGASGVELRSGRIDDTGSVVATLASGEELAAGGGQVSGSVSEADFLTAVSVSDVFASLTPFHVVIATTQQPGGAVRGQLPDGGTIPGRTAPAQTAPGETVPERAVPGETVPERAVPGETVPEPPTPAASVTPS